MKVRKILENIILSIFLIAGIIIVAAWFAGIGWVIGSVSISDAPIIAKIVFISFMLCLLGMFYMFAKCMENDNGND